MRWDRGYTAEYYATIVDPISWRDIDRIEIKDDPVGTIKREQEGIRQSAQIYCDRFPSGIENWIRIWLDVEQSGSNEHVALFTGIGSTPEHSMDGIRETSAVQCYSVLKPAMDIDLLRGWYAPTGVSGATVIRDLLSVIPAPVIIADNAPILSSAIIAENNENHLTMTDKILTAMNWRLRVQGDGTVTVGPWSIDPVATFDPNEMDVIESEISIKADWFSAPNVFMAIDNDRTAIAKDESEKSELSTVNRGREVWTQEDGCSLAENQTLEQYAATQLEKAQKVKQTANYSRRYVPDVYPGDVIRMRYPQQYLDGLYTINSQSIDLSHAATTSEEIMST